MFLTLHQCLYSIEWIAVPNITCKITWNLTEEIKHIPLQIIIFMLMARIKNVDEGQ